jgi:hypothetical protein
VGPPEPNKRGYACHLDEVWIQISVAVRKDRRTAGELV